MSWRRAAIAGVGATRQGKLPEETPLSLAAEAFRLALDDSGIDKHEVDGLLTMPGTTSPEGSKNYLTVGELVGVNPRFTGSMTLGGATGGALIQIAAMAIATGMAKTVACIFADTARTGGSRFAAAAGGDDSGGVSWGVWGMFGNAANSAMGFRRHMALYGSRSEHLGWIAVTCRKHASMNPNAVMRDPITLDDHQNSRLIVDPLRLLDCCLISDGAVCVIVTSPERARDCRNRPVAIWGMGQGHTTENLRRRDWWYLPHQQDCIADAYRMAGVAPHEISVAQLYDNFTVAVLFWLEHAGFCKEGEAGAFVEGGTRITLGGTLPINTAGGNLSESYMQGWLQRAAIARRVRRAAGAKCRALPRHRPRHDAQHRQLLDLGALR
jgi:acetyl-CoA acetyltransferase